MNPNTHAFIALRGLKGERFAVAVSDVRSFCESRDGVTIRLAAAREVTVPITLDAFVSALQGVGSHVANVSAFGEAASSGARPTLVSAVLQAERERA